MFIEYFTIYFLFFMMFSILNCLLSLNLIHSIFWLTLIFLSSSLYLMSLNLFYLGILIMIIYATGMAMIFMFSIMMMDLNMKIHKNNLFLLTPLNMILNLILLKMSFWNFSKNSFNFVMQEEKIFYYNCLSKKFFYFESISIVVVALMLMLPLMGVLIFL